MKKSRRFITVFMMLCLVVANVFCFSDTAFAAKKIKNASAAKKLAKKEVKGATVIEVDKEYEKGVLVYEVKMEKGQKEYNLIYRASDSKLIAYEWEIESWYIKKGKGKLIGTSKCKKLAKKQVSGGTVKSVARKRSDGIDVYKVKMQKGSKNYELTFHARTGKLLEYEWELKDKGSKSKYISEKKAKQIALEEVGGGMVVKLEFDIDGGIPVYDIEIVDDDGYEYEVKIHARTGKILDIEVDYNDDYDYDYDYDDDDDD